MPCIVKINLKVSVHRVVEFVEIPNNKSQMTNKLQHAAQAPALRVTEIQNSKQKTIAFVPFWNLGLVVWNLFGI